MTEVQSSRSRWLLPAQAALAAAALLLALLPLAGVASAQDNVDDPANACPTDPDPAPFTDRDEVPDVHVRNVDCAFERNIVEGFTDNTYRPTLSVRRDQMASFVARTLQEGGVELPAPDDERFSDIPAGHTHDEAIHRLKAAGIAQGGPGDLPADQYGPDIPMRRDQLVSFVARGLEFAFPGTIELNEQRETRFPDVPSTNVHSGNIEQVADFNIVEGFTDGTFGPSQSTRRDQMASIMVRLLSVLEDPPSGDPSTLTLAPEDGTNAVGSDHELTATVTDPFDDPVEGVEVRFEFYREVAGDPVTFDAGEPTTSTTNAEGVANLTYTSEVAAQDTIVACVLFDDDPQEELDQDSFCADVTLQDPEDPESPITGVAPRDDRPADSATKTWEEAEATTLVLEPESGENPVGSLHEMTATVTDQSDQPFAGAQVRFEVYREATADPVTFDVLPADQGLAATGEDGVADFSYTSATPADDLIVACIVLEDDPAEDLAEDVFCADVTLQTPSDPESPITDVTPRDDRPSDTATKTWSTPVVTGLTLDPAADVNPVGTDHTVTATVADQFEDPVEGQEVRFEVYRTVGEDPPTGPIDFGGDPAAVETTGAEGNAAFTYTGPADPAVDTIVACVGDTGAAAPESCAEIVDGTVTPDAELRTATASKTWAPAIATVTLDPAAETNPVGTEHTVTASVDNVLDDPVEGQEVRFEVYRALGEDPIAPVDFGGDPETVVTTNAEGNAAFTYTGPADPAVDTIVACVGDTGAPAPETCAEIVDGTVTPDAGLTTATAEKTWAPAIATVTLDPALDANEVSTDHTVTATVQNTLDDPVEGQEVRFEVYRALGEDPIAPVDFGGDPAPLVTTDAAGDAAFTYTGPADPAVDTIVACVSGTGAAAPESCAEIVDGTVTPDAELTTATAEKAWVAALGTTGQISGEIVSVLSSGLTDSGFLGVDQDGTVVTLPFDADDTFFDCPGNVVGDAFNGGALNPAEDCTSLAAPGDFVGAAELGDGVDVDFDATGTSTFYLYPPPVVNG